MNLTGKPPLGLKDGASGKDAEYLRRVRKLPCVICEAYGMPQLTPTEAHHCKHGRYSQAKSPDRMAIPLCAGHHRGGNGIIGVESNRQAWERLYGPDTSWIAVTQDKLERGE